MGGHGAPLPASACTTPPQSWGGPASHLRPLSKEGDSYPVSFFYTPLHTHTYTTSNGAGCKRGTDLKIFVKVEEMREGKKKKEWFLFLCSRMCSALFLLLLTHYDISTFLSSFFSTVSPITLVHNESLCLPGSCRLTRRNCSHSSLYLPRLFWRKQWPDSPLKANVWIIQWSNNFYINLSEQNSGLGFVHLNIKHEEKAKVWKEKETSPWRQLWPNS